MKKLFGFTLSEVLIAMAILGIVAALTVPQLAGNTTKKQYITAFKTTMNNLHNGIQTFKVDNGYDFSGNRSITDGTTIFRQMLEQKLGATVTRLRTNQQWLVQGVVANDFEIIGNYTLDTGSIISVYANKYFTGTTLEDTNLDPINTVQNLAFGTHDSSSDFDPPADTTNDNTSVTYKLPNGAYILTIPNNGLGCNFNNVRWDTTTNAYVTPNPTASASDDAMTNMCIAYIDVNGPKGPNRITNCMSNPVLISPYSSAICNNMTPKEVADVYPILFFDSQFLPATAAGNTILNDLLDD